MEKYYKVTDIAEMLSTSQLTIRTYIREGKLEGIKIGREWRVPQSSIMAYIDSHKIEIK